MSELKVGHHTIEVSRPDKELFPSDGITKAELVGYYRQVGPVMILPAAPRRQSLLRCASPSSRGGPPRTC